MVELNLRAASQAGIFECAVTRFGELATWTDAATPDRMPILLPFTSGPMMLEDLLDDLIHLVRFERFAAVRLERLELDQRFLRAAVSGWTGDVLTPVTETVRRHATCEETDNGWQASILLRLGRKTQLGSG